MPVEPEDDTLLSGCISVVTLLVLFGLPVLVLGFAAYLSFLVIVRGG